nr:ABC transporter B family member 19 [Tanacetum cinerariifolium]
MIAGEGVSNIRTVAAFNAQDKILSLFSAELRVPQKHLRRSQFSGMLFGISQLALFASEALILWYGAHLVNKGLSTFSKVIKVFIVLVITANSVAETVSLAPEIIRGGEAIGSVFSILDRSTRIDPDDPDAEVVETMRGEIELRHVDFAYPSRPDIMVFKDFSLRIRACQSQALVGASGSGKSSVIALIERFYDPITGRVMIDGKEMCIRDSLTAFNAQDKILSLFSAELRVPQKQSLRRSQFSGMLFGISQLALFASEALILWYGAHLVNKGLSTFSKVIKVFIVLVITANSVAETVSLAPEIIRGGEAIGSVFSILDRSTRIDPDDPDAEVVETMRGEIELRHVDFAYPSRPDIMVFKDFSLRIRAGQSQALVGASGSGKSSVIALIERFYDPITGRVMIDGKD